LFYEALKKKCRREQENFIVEIYFRVTLFVFEIVAIINAFKICMMEE